MSLQPYQTNKIRGTKNLLDYLRKNVHISQQIDILMEYFAMFDGNRGGASYTFQVNNGFSSWENILYTIIVLHNHQLIGHGQILLREQFAEIFNVIVNLDFRKKGIAREIIVELEDYAIKNNKNMVVLWCENKMVEFYSKFNYLKTDLTSLVDGLNLYQMKKKLVNY